MNMQERIQEAKEIFDGLQVAMVEKARPGSSIGVQGATGVKLLSKGNCLFTFWVGQFERRERPTPYEVNGQELHWLGKPVQPPTQVALLFDLKYRSLEAAGRYLAENELFADLVIVTPVSTYQNAPYQPVPTWQAMVTDFYRIISAIQREMPGAGLHIFINGPVALGVGLGAVWGSVWPAQVYHFENSAYTLAFRIQRDKIMV